MLKQFCELRVSDLGCRLFATTRPKKNVSEKLPSRGMSVPPFGLFVKEKFPQVADKKDVSGAMKELSQQWKKLSETEVTKYKDLAATMRKQKIAEFTALSDDQKELKIKEAEEARVKMQKGRVRRQRKELWSSTDHPKMAPTSFALFVKDQFKELKANGKSVSPVSEIVKDIRTRWASLDASTKKGYEKTSTDLRTQYAKDLEIWKANQKKQ